MQRQQHLSLRPKQRLRCCCLLLFVCCCCLFVVCCCCCLLLVLHILVAAVTVVVVVVGGVVRRRSKSKCNDARLVFPFPERASFTKLVVRLPTWSDVASRLCCKTSCLSNAWPFVLCSIPGRRIACFELLYKSRTTRAFAEFVRVVCVELPRTTHYCLLIRCGCGCLQ